MTEAIQPEGPAPSALQHRVGSSLLADQVFEVVRRRITSGEWQPGTQLRIRAVASLVGTSEMPVREAFRRLGQAGLITVEPYRGATVRALPIADLEHTYDIRIMLEAEAARQGTEQAGPDVVERMRHHWGRIQEAQERGDVLDAVSEDEKVLGALFEAGDNDVLVDLIRTVWDTCRPYKSLWASNAAEQGLATWAHVPSLIDAVTHGDSDRAYRILEQAYRDARTTVRQLLDRQTGENQ